MRWGLLVGGLDWKSGSWWCAFLCRGVAVGLWRFCVALLWGATKTQQFGLDGCVGYVVYVLRVLLFNLLGFSL